MENDPNRPIFAYETEQKMSYITGTDHVTAIQFNPEFFRVSALQSVGTDRKEFLEKELINLQAASYQYQTAVMDVMQQAAHLDGVNDVATWLTTIGAAVGTFSTGTVVSVIGWAVAGAGTVWNTLDRKKDQKRARDIQAKAQRLQLEAEQIRDYYNRYSNELQLIKFRPAIIGGIVGIIALRRK